MDNDDVKAASFLGIGCIGYVVTIVVLAIAIGLFSIWWNNNIQTNINNSERNANTCTQQYLVSQKSRIETQLNAIANNKREAATITDKAVLESMKEQDQASADDIYNALDASQCSRAQIVKDMPELQGFFDQYSR